MGSLVTGTVLARLPMGIFVGLADRVIGQVEVVAFDPADLLWADRGDVPPVGSSVTARVVGYGVGQQVRLSLRSEDVAPST